MLTYHTRVLQTWRKTPQQCPIRTRSSVVSCYGEAKLDASEVTSVTGQSEEQRSENKRKQVFSAAMSKVLVGSPPSQARRYRIRSEQHHATLRGEQNSPQLPVEFHIHIARNVDFDRIASESV